MKTTAAHQTTTPSSKGENTSQETKHIPRADFLTASLNMSWQLAIVVLVPVIGGVQLDKALNSSHVFLFIGLGLAFVGSGVVMWRAMQIANSLPVPKLSSAQKRAIQKQYEEEDKE